MIFFIIPGYGLFASVSNDVIIASVYKCQIFWGFWDENLPFNELPGVLGRKEQEPRKLTLVELEIFPHYRHRL